MAAGSEQAEPGERDPAGGAPAESAPLETWARTAAASGLTLSDPLEPFFGRARAADPAERLVGRGLGQRIWFVRHAEVHEDWRGVAYGQLDVPLSQAGEERTRQAAEAFAALPPARLLSSDLQRARAMAEAIALASGVRLELEPGLREIDRGRWQGHRVQELREHESEGIEQFYADPWRWAGHGGENDARIFARARVPLEEALRSPGAGPIVVCSHYNVIRVCAGRALGIAPERTFALRLDPGRAILLEDAAAGWVLHCSNVIAPRIDEDVSDPTHPAHQAHRSGAPIDADPRREEGPPRDPEAGAR